ncbi:sulfite oxidase [Streptomyces griseoviridis]|uniref:Sulfite oxidase n=1 Tax=Streptomyces griseoviridis TaxID=45398 RepID=A0ABT9L8P6_STRGD|nr:sulfite oxidase [Streptomyces griseoviridis]MDP9680087.1 sulfite oxidase [Streptomyces griseoviridis]GGT05374.1 sulfite oxidase [Streptomyces griseoviridis]
MNLWGKRNDMVVHEREPFNAEPPPAALTGGPAVALTSLDAFFSRNHGPIPDLDPAAWRLEVDGTVTRPLSLSLEELRTRFEETEVVATLQCAGNRRTGLTGVRPVPGETPWGPGAISTARFRGVRLADVLARAGPAPGTAHLAFTGADVAPGARPPQPYGGSVPLEKALGPEVLLAWAMNDAPLPRVHGAPLRAVVPGWIGARSVKWLRRVTARTTPSDAYFQTTAYRLLPADAGPGRTGPGDGIPLGPSPLNCAVLSPVDGSRPPAGPAQVTGYALGGEHRTVARVEVSADGGRTWRPADVDEPAGPWVWQHWRTVLDLPRGEVEIVARAWDSAGTTTPESPAALWNPRGYANTSWPRVRLCCGPG